MNSEDDYSENGYDDDDDIEEEDGEEIDDESITSEEDGEGNESSMEMESKIETDQQKADALKKQIALWDSFLELRIKLQRATITCNCLPTTMIADDEELREAIDENTKLFRKTLALLLAIDNRRSKKREHTDDDDDEEENTTDVFKTLSKRFKQGDKVIDEELNNSYEKLLPERDTVLQKWFERTRSVTKQNQKNTIEQSPIVQIKEIMSFPDRLIKRTQVSRSDYDFVCPPSSPDNAETSTDLTTKTNADLFDDGDFYHQLLREYVERKTASITDPDQISKHWAQLRKLRTKLKKNVDTKASKDRKIRYNVHKKLVNYMAPTDRCSFTDEAKSDLFSSLFGTTKLTISETEQTTPDRKSVV